MGLIERRDSVQTITVDTSTTTSTSIDLRNASGAIVQFGTGEDPGSAVEVWVSDDNATFYRLQDKTGAAAVNWGNVAAETAVPLPDESFSAHYVRLVGGTKAAATVMLKG